VRFVRAPCDKPRAQTCCGPQCDPQQVPLVLCCADGATWAGRDGGASPEIAAARRAVPVGQNTIHRHEQTVYIATHDGLRLRGNCRCDSKSRLPALPDGPHRHSCFQSRSSTIRDDAFKLHTGAILGRVIGRNFRLFKIHADRARHTKFDASLSRRGGAHSDANLATYRRS